MDFLQTFFKTNVHTNTEPVPRINILRWGEKTEFFLLHVESILVLDVQNFVQKYEPVSRFLIDPIAITCWINFSARCTNFCANVRFF